jgi:putative ABC transport system substrate-binding protein
MRRRAFIALLGAAGASGLPSLARSQQRSLPTVGVLNSSSPVALKQMLAAFHEGLREAGFVEGRNVRFEYRWAEGRYDRLPDMATDLVQRRVAVILATGDSGWSAKNATSSIPIVFANGSDPVEAKLVESLSRPVGNITGVSWTSNPLVPKRLELLRDLVPTMRVIGALVNPGNPSAAIDTHALKAGAVRLDLSLELQQAGKPDELVAAFQGFAGAKVGAVVVGADSFFASRRSEIVALTAQHMLPASFSVPEYVRAGGLMSYAPSRKAAFHLAGAYVGRILKGAKPGDLPVQLPTKFELAINLKSARALGLSVPPSLLALANEVIE